jgi:hypothetical protein
MPGCPEYGRLFSHQSPQKKFLRVRLRKVKRICMRSGGASTPEKRVHEPDSNQGSLKFSHSKSAEIFFIKV